MISFDYSNIGERSCFLCGLELDDQNRSDEHVFPEWLLHKFNLWDDQIVLLNGTSIPYRHLVIPACRECNNGCLSRLEADILNILNGAFREISAKERFRIYQWSAKILYGILRKELSLRLDRTSKTPDTILTDDFLKEFSTFHHFLSSIRRPFTFHGFQPYSLFMVETMTVSDSKKNFDYFDFVLLHRDGESHCRPSLALRLGSFGIICAFLDNGFQQQCYQSTFDKFKGVPLHPIQFLELACKASYKNYLLSFSPYYNSVSGSDQDSHVHVTQATFPINMIWQEWNQGEFDSIFWNTATSYGLQVPPRELMSHEGQSLTFLTDSNDKPIAMPILDDWSCYNFNFDNLIEKHDGQSD